MKRCSLFTALCLGMSILASSDWTNAASPPANPAQILFEEGVALLNEGKFEQACPKFKQSLAISDKPATWFASADCNDKWNHPADALSAYEAYLIAYEKLPANKKSAHAERLKTAHERIEVLRNLVASITVIVSNVKGFDVFIDDQRRGTGDSTFEFSPLDAGEHHVVVVIPGRPSFDTKVDLEKGENRRIEVAPSSEVSRSPNNPIVQQEKTLSLTHAESGKGINRMRTAGFIAFGVAAAGLLTSGVTTLLMAPNLETIDRDCKQAAEINVMECKTQTGLDAASDAKRNANISNIGLGIGAVGALVGTGLFVIGSRKTGASRDEKQSISGRLEVGPSSIGIAVNGTW